MGTEGKCILPEFQEELKNHTKSLTAGTYWRYVNGLLPAFGKFIVSNPELAEALARDARKLALTQQNQGGNVK